MESIIKHIESVLCKDFGQFLADKLVQNGITVESKTIDGYILEWLGKPAQKQTTKQTPKQQSKQSTKQQPQQSNVDESNLDTITVADLRKLCAKYGVSKSGAKIELVNKIKEARRKTDTIDKQEFDQEPEKCKIDTSHEKRVYDSDEDKRDSEEDEPKPIKRKLGKKKTVPVCVEKIEQEKVKLRTDDYGNVYEKKHGFVFDPDNQVIGRLDKKHNVMNLTKEDIELCKERNLMYVVPFDTEEDDE